MAQAIEDAGDLVVGEAPRQITHHVEGGLIGAASVLSALLSGYFELGVLAAFPVNHAIWVSPKGRSLAGRDSPVTITASRSVSKNSGAIHVHHARRALRKKDRECEDPTLARGP
jgi:hypothetical protein